MKEDQLYYSLFLFSYVKNRDISIKYLGSKLDHTTLSKEIIYEKERDF